jgi:hypothetical protein
MPFSSIHRRKVTIDLVTLKLNAANKRDRSSDAPFVAAHVILALWFDELLAVAVDAVVGEVHEAIGRVSTSFLVPAIIDQSQTERTCDDRKITNRRTCEC